MTERARILVVDDDLSMREFLEFMLAREGYDVTLAADGENALMIVPQHHFDLVITDIRMKRVNGIDVLRVVKAVNPDTVVILISAFATTETAVTAMQEGAYDFIPKPFQIEELKGVIRNALALRTPEAESLNLAQKVKEGCHFGNLVGQSPVMIKVYDLVKKAAQTATNVVITGESGTGKELVARAIHDNSPRNKEQFVAINCGAMPEQLIESELFGYRKGAFTGANTDKLGLFELAQNGTIFLDELAELSLAMQVKLLRVVQDRTYRAVGGTREKVLNVRFIAATNKELEMEVMANRFREDLYYRLNVITIKMPALRERKGDIPLLAQYFLEKYGRLMKKDVRKVSSYALDILSNYDFPGNVRELENIIERSVALEQSNIILPESLTLASFKRQQRLEAQSEIQPMSADPEPDQPAAIPESIPSPGELNDTNKQIHHKIDLDEILDSLEKRLLVQALRQSENVHQKTAQLLSISTWRLRGRLRKYGLSRLSAERIEELVRQVETNPRETDNLGPPWDSRGVDLDQALIEVERSLLLEALAKADGSKTKAADLLSISRRTLHHRLSRTGVA